MPACIYHSLIHATSGLLVLPISYSLEIWIDIEGPFSNPLILYSPSLIGTILTALHLMSYKLIF